MMWNAIRALIVLTIVALPSNAAFVSFQANRSVGAAVCADSVPAAASAFGFNTCTFAFVPTDLSRVDINNTGTSTASTDFWVANSYQNFVAAASDFSINNGAMKVNKSGCTTAGAGHACTSGDNSPTITSIYCPLATCIYTTNGRGRTFKNGFLIRYTFAFDQSISNGSTPFPSFWSANWMGALAAGDEYIESDPLDAKPGLAGTVIQTTYFHDWNAVANGGNGSDAVTEFSPPAPVLTLDGVAYNTVDWLWVPTTKNGGTTGIFRIYYNGALMTNFSLDYTQTGMAGIGSGSLTNNFNGAFYNAEVNSKGFAIFISVGRIPPNGDWPTWVKNVQVWQTTTSDMLVAN